VSRALIFKLISDGRLRSFKVGRCRRIPLDAIDELLAGQVPA
jgi:excisionase family DNA binding protein